MERYRKRNTSEREKVSAIMQIKEEKQLRGLTALLLLRKQAWGYIVAYFLPLISPETGQTGAFYGIVWDLYPHQAPQALLPVASVCTDSSCPVLGCCSSSWHTRAQHHDMAGEGLGRLWGGSQGAPWHHSTPHNKVLGSVPPDAPLSPASEVVRRAAGQRSNRSPRPETCLCSLGTSE